MNPEKQADLINVALNHYENDYASPEAKKGLKLTSSLKRLNLAVDQPGEWFDHSIHARRMIATRIRKQGEVSESPDLPSSSSYVVEVGISGEGGMLDRNDPNLLVVTWAEIEVNDDAHGHRYPTVFTMNPAGISHADPEVEIDVNSPQWDQLQYTLDQAELAYGPQI